MIPTLTTPRNGSPIDSIPVHILKEDDERYLYDDNNQKLDDLHDITLVPVGSNTRIQVYFIPPNIFIT